ncbi:MAG: hypothetical protein J0I41_13340 [Filimonas sp.]|nr:hypothetical protein [Filimonas sp.]
MKKNYFRLGSTVPGGLGGPQTIAFDTLYAYMLSEVSQAFYRCIFIVQIDKSLDELVHFRKHDNEAHVNLIYPVDPFVDEKSEFERNVIRLDFVHMGMLRLAAMDDRIKIDKLEEVKNYLIENEFIVDVLYKKIVNKKDKTIIGRVVFNPSEKVFSFFLIIENFNKERKRYPIGEVLTTEYTEERPYYDGQWISDQEIFLINCLTGQEFNFRSFE